MSLLKIAKLGNPILRQVAQPVPVEELGSRAFQEFVDDMFETMNGADGIGLAGPQVYRSQQVLVLGYPGENGFPETVLVNPKILHYGPELSESWEGCLSVPGLRGCVPRFTAIRLRAYDRRGTRVDLVTEGFHARVIQHECDHLQGKVFVDRMRDMSSLTFVEEFVKYGLHE